MYETVLIAENHKGLVVCMKVYLFNRNQKGLVGFKNVLIAKKSEWLGRVYTSVLIADTEGLGRVYGSALVYLL